RANGASLRGGGWFSNTISDRSRRCWSIPASRSVTADRKMTAASISARFADRAAGLMIRACDTAAQLSCHPVPPLQRFHRITQRGAQADQQGSAAVGAGPLGTVAVRGVWAAPGGRVVLLEQPVPDAAGAVPDRVDHQTSSPPTRCWPCTFGRFCGTAV